MKTLFLASFLVVLAAGCSKKSDSSCEAVYEHTLSLVPDGLKGSMEGKKAEALAKCEKLSPEARQCALDAAAFEDLMKCPRK
ncbi:MAG: hypothetical protein ABI867_34765 [Kofleriaceae bacterium]